MAPPMRGDIRDQQVGAVVDSAKYLNLNMEKAPVMLIPLLEGVGEVSTPGCRPRSGVDPVGGVEFHAGPARARYRYGVDHAAPDRRR